MRSFERRRRTPKATSPDAALPASGLAVDCWDWPVAYPQIRDERAAPASATRLAEYSRRQVSAAFAASQLRPQPPHQVLILSLRWITSFLVLSRILSTSRFGVKKKIRPKHN